MNILDVFPVSLYLFTFFCSVFPQHKTPGKHAICSLSDDISPKHLCHRGWAGGAQLCLSNAFGETKRLEAQAQDLSRDFWYLGWMDDVW